MEHKSSGLCTRCSPHTSMLYKDEMIGVHGPRESAVANHLVFDKIPKHPRFATKFKYVMHIYFTYYLHIIYILCIYYLYIDISDNYYR